MGWFVIFPNFPMDFHFVLLSDYDLFHFLDLDFFFLSLFKTSLSFSIFGSLFIFSFFERLWSFFLFGFWSFFFFTFQKIMILFLFRILIVFVFFLWSSKYDKKFLGSKFYSHFVWDSTSKIFRYWETCILFKYICWVMWFRKIIKSNIYINTWMDNHVWFYRLDRVFKNGGFLCKGVPLYILWSVFG